MFLNVYEWTFEDFAELGDGDAVGGAGVPLTDIGVGGVMEGEAEFTGGVIIRTGEGGTVGVVGRTAGVLEGFLCKKATHTHLYR